MSHDLHHLSVKLVDRNLTKIDNSPAAGRVCLSQKRQQMQAFLSKVEAKMDCKEHENVNSYKYSDKLIVHYYHSYHITSFPFIFFGVWFSTELECGWLPHLFLLLPIDVSYKFKI